MVTIVYNRNWLAWLAVVDNVPVSGHDTKEEAEEYAKHYK